MVEFKNMRESLSDILSIPLDQLRGDLVLEANENWDSLARIGAVALIFETTGASVSPEEIGGVVTLQDLFDLASRKAQQAK